MGKPVSQYPHCMRVKDNSNTRVVVICCLLLLTRADVRAHHAVCLLSSSVRAKNAFALSGALIVARSSLACIFPTST